MLSRTKEDRVDYDRRAGITQLLPIKGQVGQQQARKIGMTLWKVNKEVGNLVILETLIDPFFTLR